MYKKISIAFTFIATIIGAGFASGREISLYFAHTSILTPMIAGGLLGVFCYVFLELGRLSNGNMIPLLGRGRQVFDGIVIVCNFIMYCAMIAASELAIRELFGINGGAVITGVLVLITMFCGKDKIRLLNAIIVPCIIVLLGIFFFSDSSTAPFERFSVVPAFTYATMNILTSGCFISTFGHGFTQKDSVQTAVFSGIILSILLVVVYVLIQRNLDEAMPLLATADRLGYRVLGNIVVYLSIYTSLVSGLFVTAKGKFPAAVFLTAVAFGISLFGFVRIVNFTYPIIGVIGSIVSLYCVFILLKRKADERKNNLPNGTAKNGGKCYRY